MSMTTKIVIWMSCGLVVGSLINVFASDVGFIQVYLVNGLFHVIGSIFINVLKMLVIPLLTFSLICGVCSIGDIAALGRIGIKSFLLFLLTTALAAVLAITVAVTVNPWKGVDMVQVAPSTLLPQTAPSWADILIGLIPTNPVSAYVEGNMLQIIFFVILFSICVLMVGERGRPIVELSEILNKVMMQVVSIVMKVAPIGIFALVAKAFSEQGSELILPVIGYISLVAIVLILHAIGTLMFLLKLLGRVNPVVFMKKIRSVQIFAFSTSSSNATIPITLHTAEKRLGIDKSIASFVVPFGATLNMDGTAITHGVAAVFIANVYGIDLGIIDYFTIVAITILASIGTAGIPGLGLAMLAMVFNQVGLPVEGIALILGVDRILDMMRTAVNVTGDAVIALIISRSENNLSMEVFNDPDAGQNTDESAVPP